MRCEFARTDHARAKCRDPAVFQAQAERLAGLYLQQVMTEQFLARVAKGESLPDRLLAAVVAQRLETDAESSASDSTRSRTDHYWRLLVEAFPKSLPAQVGRLRQCALREDANCALSVAESLNGSYPDNAWGAMLLGVGHWSGNRPLARQWFHESAQRPGSDLGVWQSVLLIHHALQRHVQPAEDDPLDHTPAALLEVAMGIQAAALHPHRDIQQACRDANLSADVEACLSAADAMAGANDLILTRVVGLQLRAQYLDRLSRTDEAAAARQRLSEFQDGAQASLAHEPAFIDAQVTLAYLHSCAQFGEIEALNMFRSTTPVAVR